jgi:hypothetical protein
MADSSRRRFLIALAISFALHIAFATQAQRVGFDIPAVNETVRVHTEITKWKPPPLPTPDPTPTPKWTQLDRSMVKNVRLTPADEQIVVLAARQSNGAPSRAPHILRVDIRPGVVHEKSVMHIKVLTAANAMDGAEGVYIHFIVWEVGVPPVGTFRLPRSDPDYPGQRYELFERDYEVPAIPAIYRNRTYKVEVIATGAQGIASGAFVPVRVL